LSPSEIFNLDVDMAGMYRRAMDVQGRKSATREGKHKKAAIQRWTPWSGFRNLRSQTTKVVATFAFIYNYVRPNIEIF
jgi:hypothetical protein